MLIALSEKAENMGAYRREAPTITHITTPLRDTGLENVGDLKTCMRPLWGQFSSRRLLGVDRE